jgi:hypothetical protein
MDTMNTYKLAFATVAVISTLVLPGLSRATSIYHAANGEAGVTYHPDHARNSKSRAEALAELEAARQDGTLALMQRGAPLPIKHTGLARTRQQVIEELVNESPEQRRARLELLAGA